MKILIDGTQTINKGSELMLYAVLGQIEKSHPNAKVIFNTTGSSIKNVNTSLDFKQPLRFQIGRYPRAILNRFKILHITTFFPRKDIDLVLDAGGFRWGDQWEHSEKTISELNNFYKTLKVNGTRIVLLPQAFGPFRTANGKRTVSILSDYADLIIARENVSRDHLLDAACDPSKIMLFPDFTASVNGILPEAHKELKSSFCVIPNNRMVTHTSSGLNAYLKFIENIIHHLQSLGQNVFLLNHEGNKDLKICRLINERLSNRLKIVTGLNAIEVKGVIGASRLVISSRYHGVASSLNQGVPCFATSWSHKYELLFKDYGLTEHVLRIEQDPETIKQKIEFILNPKNYNRTKDLLYKKTNLIHKEIEHMWGIIWEKACC